MVYCFYIVTDGKYQYSVMDNWLDFSIIEYLHKFSNHDELIIYKDYCEGTHQRTTVMLGKLDDIYETMKEVRKKNEIN